MGWWSDRQVWLGKGGFDEQQRPLWLDVLCFRLDAKRLQAAEALRHLLERLRWTSKST
jgi:hypothetical protein